MNNGAEFESQFHWHTEALDIRHVYIRPRTPGLNGKVERSHRVDDQEFTSCWISTASPMISTHSIRSCVSGRTTTITIVRTGRSTGRPRTNDFSQRPELRCH